MEWKMKIREIIRQVGYVRLILLLVCGMFLIAVSLPEKKEGSESQKEETTQRLSYDTDENDIYVEKMEDRLADILRMIEGAGRVEVMITLASSSEAVVNKDQSLENDSEKETGQNGNEKTSSIQKEETVFSEKDGNQNPYVIKTMEPVVEGIIVVMDGGNNPQVAGAVTEAVQALFHVDAHKIKVLKMEDGS